MKAWIVAVPSASGSQQEYGTRGHQKRWATNRGSTCPNTESDVRLAVVPEGVCLGRLCCATAEPFVGEANQNAP
jgi:hypothetical protein